MEGRCDIMGERDLLLAILVCSLYIFKLCHSQCGKDCY